MHATKKFEDGLGSEFLAIVCMEYLWITNQTKVLLEFVGNQAWALTGKAIKCVNPVG